MMYEDCHRCHTPKMPGHRLVCVLHAVAEISFWAGLLCLVAFWVALALLLTNVEYGVNAAQYVFLFGTNAALLMLLSVVTGMRAKWLRHAMVADLEEYLDDEGSCCGGACAGSCGAGGCGDGGCEGSGCKDGECTNEGCAVDESALPPDEPGAEGGCCGGGCCK